MGWLDPTCVVEKVCVPGYTDTVRPPTSYTNKLKRIQMEEMALGGDMASYEEDHVVPLALCGHPTDPRNLVPQPWDRARRKDVYEARFHRAVCRGTMTLEEAQRKVVVYE